MSTTSHLVCPGCGYDLSSVPLHPDREGHVRCPECGGVSTLRDARARHPVRHATLIRWIKSSPRGTLVMAALITLGAAAAVGIMLVFEMSMMSGGQTNP